MTYVDMKIYAKLLTNRKYLAAPQVLLSFVNTSLQEKHWGNWICLVCSRGSSRVTFSRTAAAWKKTAVSVGQPLLPGNSNRARESSVPGRFRLETGKNYFSSKSGEALQQTAQWGEVTVPGHVQELCKCAFEGHDFGVWWWRADSWTRWLGSLFQL